MTYPLTLALADAVSNIQVFAQTSLDDRIATAEKADSDFFSSDLGGVIASFFRAGGILIVIVAIVKALKEISGGNIGKAVKGILGAVVIAVFMFEPRLISTLIAGMTGIVEAAINTVSDLGSGS